MYAKEDLELGLIPGVQDSIELEQVKVRINEIRTTLAFVMNLDYVYRDHHDPRNAPSSSE